LPKGRSHLDEQLPRILEDAELNLSDSFRVLLGRIGEVAGEIPGGGGEFHLVVLHHTDCGITRLAGDPAKLAHYFQIQEGELKTKAVTDPWAAVAVDVAALRAIPALPGAWLISGLVYDVATGLVEIVVPSAPIRTA
jgi:carbonic anhydrase